MMFCSKSLFVIQLVVPWFTASSYPYPPPKFETTVYTLSGPKTYLAQTAVFGKELKNNRTYNANLWLPPGDMDLCSYPTELDNVTKSDMEVIDTAPIALLISRGNCSFDDKARVALVVRNRLLSNLQFLFVVNNNQTHPDELVIMSTSADPSSKEQLNSMSYLLVSKRSGDGILTHLQTYAKATGQSPYLGAEVNTNWLFVTAFRQSVPNAKGRTNGRGGGAARSTFHWLRFVLFSLLIVSPCARAVYLWYSAGGRVMFRRTEDGRITGLMYVRPMPYWFASGQGTNNSEDEDPGHCNLTEEQVLELPEIKFKKPRTNPDEDDIVDDEEETKTQDTDVDDLTGSSSPRVVDEESAVPDVVVQTTTAGGSKSSIQAATQSADFVSSDLTAASMSPSASGEEDPVAVASHEETEHDEKEVEETEQEESAIETSCTMCSICIDDFEEGEKIRVLPRCGHGYHLECLKPWLTERQGCCPLCKTPVLGPEPSPSEQQQHEETGANASTASDTNSTTTTNDCPA